MPVAPLVVGDDLVASTNLRDTQTLRSMASNMTGNAIMYMQDRIFVQRAYQLGRYGCVRLLMPLFAKGNLVTLASLESLISAFRCLKHPKLQPFVIKMQNELAAYNAAVARCLRPSLPVFLPSSIGV